MISIQGSIQLPKTFQVKSWEDKVIIDNLKKQYESRILDDDIIIIMVVGNIVPTETTLEDNGSKSYTVMFDTVSFTPNLQEIVQGEVIEVTDFGMIVRIGPVDAYVHKSQIFDGYGKIDMNSRQIISENGKVIAIRTVIRGRITSISIPNTGGIKVGMTCKEPDFGPKWK